jgi:hypothetical protein
VEVGLRRTCFDRIDKERYSVRIHPVTCIKPLKFEKVMQDVTGLGTGEFARADVLRKPGDESGASMDRRNKRGV